MGVIVVVCGAFGLTISGAKTVIICLRTKGMPGTTPISSVEAAHQMYHQTNKFICLGGDVNHNNTDLSIEVDRYIRNAWCSFRKYTLELYDRPSAPPQAQIPDAKIRGTRDNVIRLRHVEPARVPLRHAAMCPLQLLDSLHRSAREQPHRPPDFLSGHPHEDLKTERRRDDVQ